ncbi:MAG: hypothetical protein E7384_04550 [Ruminococcaceae bacterium]|nr:hypothetical protein [Oscillospiraceae bacterium]
MKLRNRVIALVLMLAVLVGNYSIVSNVQKVDAATAEYIQSLRDAGFPESYVTTLVALHEQHPTWQFEPVMITQLDSKMTWDYVTSTENSAAGDTYYNLVTTSTWAPGDWGSLGQANYSPYYDSSNTNLYDSGWRKASLEAIKYFMDPRNFLNEDDIFMFESLEYNSAYQNATNVNTALSGSFMANANCDNGMTYAQHITNVGATYNISPIFLASRLRQEQGTGESPQVNGTLGTTLWDLYSSKADYDANGNVVWGTVSKDTSFTQSELLQYDGYYNFFNMGASGTGVFAIYLGAGREAKTAGWTTKAAAITGGAQKVSNNFIKDYQNTLYFQKFNVDPRSGDTFPYGQYMQNIAAPLTEGRTVKSSYENNGLFEVAHKFKIPVYSGMPETRCADPANGNSYYSANELPVISTYNLSLSATGNGTVGFDENGTTSTVVAADTVVNFFAKPDAGYKVSSVVIDGSSVEVLNGGIHSVYQFTMPAHDVAIKVTFELAFSGNFDPKDLVFSSQEVVDWVVAGGVSENVAVGARNEGGDKSCVFVSPSTSNNDPQANFDFSTTTSFSADTYKYMTIVAKTSATNTQAGMFFCAGSTTAPTAECYKTWNWTNDGLWHEYIIDLSDLSLWTGTANKIRFDFFEGETNANSELLVHSIKFTSTKPVTASVKTNSQVYNVGDNIIISFSKLTSYTSSAETIKPFVAIYAEGTSPGSTGSLQYAQVSGTSGSLTFPTAAIGGTSLGTLPAGNYTAWLAYDATDSNGTYIVNNVHMNGCEGYSFSIVSDSSTTSSYEMMTGGFSGANAIKADKGDTVVTAISAVKALTGASSVTIQNADGSSVSGSALIGTGMVATAGNKTYDIVVMGDADGDGSVTIADAQIVMLHLKSSQKLSGAYADAAKAATRSGAIDIIDVMTILNNI